MNILDTIVAYKKKEVTENKRLLPQSILEAMPLFEKPAYSLKKFLSDDIKSGIIAEYKRRSPSKGIINSAAGVAEVTTAYAAHGASGLSVLTDGPSFGGCIDDLATARLVSLPILRKEFIIDEYQLIEAKAFGADAILLIAAILSKQEVADFSVKAMDLGMETILEVHEEKELGHLTEAVTIIGVNNRNLKTFDVNIEQSARLAALIPNNKLKISESGIHSVKDVEYLKTYGYKGFLMGEYFMKDKDPGVAFKRFTNELKTLKS